MTHRGIAAVLICISFVYLWPSAAEEASPQDACDALAAHPLDPQLPEGIKGTAFQDIDAEQALKICIIALRQRPFNPRLMFQLGRSFDASRSSVNALKWLKLASKYGYAQADVNLGTLYSGGFFVPHDDLEAAKWYRLGAVHNHMVAQYNLGVMYSNGLGVPLDKGEAEKWYGLAAAQGHASAQLNLGVLYAQRAGHSEDYHKSMELFRSAADQGNIKAKVNLETAALLSTTLEFSEAVWLSDMLQLDR